MHSNCLQLPSQWFKSSCNFATMLLLLDGNLKVLLCFIMMCRIEVHCEAHCAKSMVASQGLEASSQFGAMLLLLLNEMQYSWFQASFIFDGSTFKFHQCFFNWISHDYKFNVIVNGIGVCQLCQSYFLQLFWRVSILDISFKFMQVPKNIEKHWNDNSNWTVAEFMHQEVIRATRV